MSIALIDKLRLYGFSYVLMEQVMLSPNGLFMLHQSLYPSKTFQYNSQG